MYFLYDVLLLLYALMYLPYLLVTKRGYQDFDMRFGFFGAQVEAQIKQKANIWLHAVSVGEVMALDGIVDQLNKNYPAYQLLVTVTTKTGYALARQRLGSKALVIPSPIDFSFVTRSFVSLIAPKIYIAVETEIWPNLYRQLHAQGVPLVVINGRISDTSFGRYKAVRFWLKGVLNQVSRWCMQSQRDAKRIMDLGAEPSRVVVTGNLKFDASSLPEVPLLDQKDGSWWVAGSTHPGEEEIVLDVYAKIIKDNPQWRLVMAPRHVERALQVMNLVTSRGFKAVKLSEMDSRFRGNDNCILIVDTIGQLRALYASASLVFVGKTFAVGGGQNIIEPAFYGKAIVIGPRYENFKAVVACFKEANAIVQCTDAQDFEATVRQLCADHLKREALGAAAKGVIAENQGATQLSLARIAEFLK